MKKNEISKQQKEMSRQQKIDVILPQLTTENRLKLLHYFGKRRMMLIYAEYLLNKQKNVQVANNCEEKP